MQALCWRFANWDRQGAMSSFHVSHPFTIKTGQNVILLDILILVIFWTEYYSKVNQEEAIQDDVLMTEKSVAEVVHILLEGMLEHYTRNE